MKKISFKTNILNWLDKCQFEIQNITNLNEAIKQYIDVVKMINNKYESKVGNMKELITKTKDNFEIAAKVANEYYNTCAELEFTFWNKVIEKLEKEGICNAILYPTNKNGIQEARFKKSGATSEVLIKIDLLKLNSNEKIFFQIGSASYQDNIFVTVAKSKNDKWNTEHEKEFIQAINDKFNYKNYKFKKTSWAYGTLDIENYQLRNENLITVFEKIEEFIFKIIEIKKELTRVLKEAKQ